MATNENLETFRRVIELGFNEGKLNELDKIVSTEFVEHQFLGESGPRGLKSLIGQLRTAFPDLKMTIEDSAVSGEKVWVRLRCQGTHNGPLMGIAPTGRKIDTSALEVCRFEKGKLVEHWGVPDRFAAMSQLGVLPGPKRE